MDVEDLSLALNGPARSIVDNDQPCLAAAAATEASARYIARNLDQRDTFFATFYEQSGNYIWDTLGSLWKELASSFSPSARPASSEDSRIDLATGLGKLERNLLAGVKSAQDAAVAHEVHIRALIFHLTTFVRIEDQKFFNLHAILTQTLSNLISPTSSAADDAVYADQYLRLYLSGKREDDIIIRLLDSRDPKTNLATLHLINNITRNSPSRLRLLLSEDGGTKWLSNLLGRLDNHLESSDDHFELTTSIFTSFIDLNLQARLFGVLSSPDEPISPSQTTFLKLLDSNINSSHSLGHSSTSPSSSSEDNLQPSPNGFLIPVFHLLSAYCLMSMKSGRDDARLPKVLEGLVLVSEIFSGIGLAVQGRKDRLFAAGLALEGSNEELEMTGEEEMIKEMKSVEETGLIKPIIELLAELNKFLPRVKPMRPDPLPPSSTTQSAESNHELQFTNIKRDLVRLLSVLTFQDKEVGDQVRLHGGVPIILGLCEVDERNPFLRELALFTVRNLMLNNPENQAVIGQMDPLGLVGENGELLPLPEKMKKTPSVI